MKLLLLFPFLFLAACSSSVEEQVEAAPGPAGDPLEALRADAAALSAKSEHDADEVEVQHILIGFKGAPRMTVSRSKEEAERLAGEILLKIQAGADFSELVSEYTDDSAPGIYTMTKDTRSKMVAGFGDVAWKLDVGEVGVSPWEKDRSPFGWHIIKRLR